MGNETRALRKTALSIALGACLAILAVPPALAIDALRPEICVTSALT